MSDTLPPQSTRNATARLIAGLVVGNVLLGMWQLYAFLQIRELKDRRTQQATLYYSFIGSQGPPIYQRVSERNNAAMRDLRRLLVIAALAREKDEFPVNSGNAIVSRLVGVRDTPRKTVVDPEKDNKVRGWILSAGNHRLKYSFKETWGKDVSKWFSWGYQVEDNTGWETNTVAVDLPTGQLHEIVFAFEPPGIRVSVQGHHEQTFDLRPCIVTRHRPFRYVQMLVPNQHLAMIDQLSSTTLFARRHTVPNELLYTTVGLKSTSNGAKGAIRLRCWAESDAPASVSALAVAANGVRYVERRPQRRRDSDSVRFVGPKHAAHTFVDIKEVSEMFEPHDGSGNLYIRNMLPRQQ